MESRKVVVTGGAGFIGSHVVDALLARNYEVHIIDNLSSGKRDRVPSAAILHEVDIRNRAALAPIMEGARFVFHLAAIPSVPLSIEQPEETHDVNINGTFAVLLAARDAKVEKFVYTASAAAFASETEMPLVETSAIEPVSPYGLQKYIGEEYTRMFALSYGFPGLSLRYFNVYGPRMNTTGSYATVIGAFLRKRAEGGALPVYGDGEQTRDFVHVRDIARANVLAAESSNTGKGEVYNICSGTSVSINTLAKLFGAATTQLPPRQEIRHSLGNPQKALDAFGWKPEIALEDGVTELLAAPLQP